MKTHKALAALAIAAFGLWTISAAFAQSGPSPTGSVEVTPAKKAPAKPAAVKGTVSTTTVKPVTAAPAKSGTATTTVKPVTATAAKGTTTKTTTAKTASASTSSSKVGARTVIGEVVDPACWLVNGAKGPTHKECAIACAKAGQVLGIVEKKTQKLYVVANDKPGEDPNKGLIDYVGQTVLVKGRVYSRGGATGIKVNSVEPYSATALAE
ncbi:MAG TPA: hypothetical protein VK527_09855 [Candidatus Limnocylindrales bacterium]|jgi:hypothetical protein|nr:hypothetical protein [Candidatus Limnocylindrales bacterium]